MTTEEPKVSTPAGERSSRTFGEPHDAESTTVMRAPVDVEEALSGEDCLICIYGGPLGRRFLLHKERVVVGRGRDCDITIQHDTVSRRHASIGRMGERRVVRDLGSTNGVHINGSPVDEGDLRSGDYVKIGEVIFKYLAGDNIESLFHEEIYRLAIEDGLTRIPNKRYLLEFLDREFSRANRYDRPLSLMMIDLDHFKAVNDNQGHLAGDAVLADFADLIRPRVRKEECFARYGGEEFAVVMPETNLLGATRFAENLCEMTRAHTFRHQGTTIRITTSVGVSVCSDETPSAQALLERADRLLRLAKQAGRDRVEAG